jgi:hypothetical protein
MKITKKLTLHRESLKVLDNSALEPAAGAATNVICTFITCPNPSCIMIFTVCFC